MAPVPAQYLSPREVGDLIGTSGDTIRRMIKSKDLQAIRMPPGNYYKVAPIEVLRYIKTHNLPLTETNRQLLEAMIVESNGGSLNA
jgi:excisionase family DNA binding protein